MAVCDNPVNSKNRGILTFELTTTALCDLDCTYCFEGVKSNPKKLEQLDLLVDRIKEILQTDWFKDNYEGASLSFWGGEPTLNFNYIIKLINSFADDDRMSFHTYTNGYNTANIEKIITSCDTTKLNIQLSYDGRAINDIFRLTRNGKTTSDHVLETLDWLVTTGIPISVKATLPGSAMDKIHECWLDFRDLHNKYRNNKNVSISYAPTLDYAQKFDDPEYNKSEKVQLFRNEILKVAKDEIKFYEENGRFLMTWFTGSGKGKANCSAGLNMIAVDVDGKTYACHGALYAQGKEALQSSSIFDGNFINNIISFNDSFEESVKDIPQACKDCVATTCIVCPVSTFQLSGKETTKEKWGDRAINGLCEFYQAFGEIDRSVHRYLKKK